MKKIIITLILSFCLITNVKAITMTDEEIEDYSILIGTYLFTEEPEKESGWTGILTTKFAMLAAGSIEGNTVDSMTLSYKFGTDDWADFFTNETIETPTNINITHINGVCVDPSCSGETYKVTFAASEYNDEKIINVGYNQTTSKDKAPTIKNKVGFKFSHWSKKGETEEYDFSKPITEDVELEINWTQLNYNITYHSNFDIEQETKTTCTYDNNNLATSCKLKTYNDILGSFDNVGHEFIGWMTSPKSDKVYTTESDIEELLTNEDIHLYAKWDNNSYKFEYQGTIKECKYDELCTLKDFVAEQKAGYEFSYWYIMDNGEKTILTEEVRNLTTENKTFELIPEYRLRKYSINYVDVTNNPNPTNLTIEDTVTLKPVDKDGYTFNKWELISSTDNAKLDGNTLSLVKEKPDTVTLRPVWTPNSITIKFQLEDGTIAKDQDGNDMEGITCNFNEECIITKQALTENIMPIPTTEGGETEPTETEPTETEPTETEPVETEPTETDPIPEGEPEPDPSLPAYELAFIGWQYNGALYEVDKNISNQDLFLENNKEIIMTPKWIHTEDSVEANPEENRNFKITYELNGGAWKEFTTPITNYIKGETSLTLQTPVKKGYTFNGWILNDVEPTNEITLNNEDITLTASWKTNTYTIEFYDGVNKIDTVSCTYYETCSFGDHQEHFAETNFIGWGYDESTLFYGDNLDVINLTDEANGVVKLVAVKASPYKISFHTDGGSMKKPNHITSYVNLDKYIPTKTGYQFLGWKTATSDTHIKGMYVPEKDILFVADWEINTYTLTFKEGDITETHTVTYKEIFDYANVTEVDTTGTWIINGEEVTLREYFAGKEITSNLTFEKKIEVTEPPTDPEEPSDSTDPSGTPETPEVPEQTE